MNEVLLELLPLILGAVLVPLYPIVVLLLLLGEGGWRTALAFVAGALAVRLAQGLLFGPVFGEAVEAHPEDGAQLIASTLLLVIGLLLLLAAIRKWRKQPDPDDPPPQWMAALSGLSASKALGAGAVLLGISVKQWVLTLTAIDILQSAASGAAGFAGQYLLYTLATQVLVLPPLLVYAIAPGQTAGPLRAAQAWLERYNRPIVISVSLIFGVLFLYKGVTGLAG
jgi:putative Mn2+ efflux pump MntP